MDINNLLKGYKFAKCESCKKECSGHLDYGNLCSNLNYLEEYGERNYLKNRNSFFELKKLMFNEMPTIFSFGCGLGLDYIGAKEVFGNNLKYYGIEECDWAITKTDNYKTFVPKLPQTISFEVGSFILSGIHNNTVLCFFNSLFTISENTDLSTVLFEVLQNREKFYILCDFTINSNYRMPTVERKFIENLMLKLKSKFSFNCLNILDGAGIIVVANKH